MKNRLHILVAIAAILTLFASCGRNEAEVIPRRTMAKIYAEMFVTDQWISSTPGVRRIADTSLVYEPILKKYGYDSEDYRLSIDKYMDDPERFSRILRETADILDARIEVLTKEQARLLALERLPKVNVNFNIEELSKYHTTEPYVHYFDSLDVRLDSATLLYNLISIERSDTTYDGLRMVIKDTTAVADTISLKDTVKAGPPKPVLPKAGGKVQKEVGKVQRDTVRRPVFDKDVEFRKFRTDTTKREE